MSDDDDFEAGFVEGYGEALADMAALLKQKNPRGIRGIESAADELAARLPRPSMAELLLVADRRRCWRETHACAMNGSGTPTTPGATTWGRGRRSNM